MRDIVDLDRYPLDRPGSGAWRDLVARMQGELADAGMFDLPGFLRPEAINRTLDTLGALWPSQSFEHRRRHNIYFRPEVEGLERGHPALAEVETASHTLTGDQIEGDLRALYEWEPFAAFLAAAMGKERLFVMDDPLADLNAIEYRAGEALNWHFDRSEFTTTILLQAPDAGGVFEYRPGLRSEEEPNYAGVARLLRGEDAEMRRQVLVPGTLNVFRGRNTAHRVTPVEGSTARRVAVFSFYDRPGVRMTPDTQRGFYGRAA
jgi:hypothetical protein